MVHLPQELVDKIIVHLDGDERSLFACSLVCRSWLSPSRAILSVEFYMILKEEDITESGRAILQFMDSPHYTYHASIKHLALHGDIPNAWDETSWQSLDQRFIKVIRGSRLRTLEIGYHRITPRLLTLLCAHFSTSITELNIQQTIHFAGGDTLVGFVSAFVVLESLTLRRLELTHVMFPFEGGARCPSTLRRLDVGPAHPQPRTCLFFFTWLAAHEVLPPIQTLILSGMGLVVSKAEVFGDVIRKLGNSLRVLEIRFLYGRMPLGFVYRPFLDLTSNRALETLHLFDIDVTTEEQDTIPLILGGVPPSIRKLVLNTNRMGYHTFLECDWSGPLDSLVCPVFSTVGGFSFDAQADQELEGAGPQIEKLLKDAFAKRFPPGVFSIGLVGV